MKNKTFWIGYVAVFVLMNAFGYLVHEIGLSATYESLASVFRPKAEMDSMMWMMFASALVSVLLFCHIFTLGYQGKGVMEGVRYGTLIGIFVSIPMSVDHYVIYPLPGELAVIWFVVGVVGFVMGGALFASIYKPASA